MTVWAMPATPAPSELAAGRGSNAMALRVLQAGHRFGRRQVFSGLDLDVAAGERVHLGGPNGSGKTTLLRCLAGTLAVRSGSISVYGSAATTRWSRAHLGVSLNPEQAFYLRLSGHDNLLLAARLRVPAALVNREVDSIERELDISFAGERVQTYSSGMRSRLAMARALLGEPPLLLLDEPTRSLDSEGRSSFWAAVERRGVACVIASHLASDRDNCDRALQLPVLL